jgi:hypothetical protein
MEIYNHSPTLLLRGAVFNYAEGWLYLYLFNGFDSVLVVFNDVELCPPG